MATQSASVDARQITETLGGRWHGGYGTAPCPICQPEARRDQTALSISDGNGRLLLHCFKAGCGFRDILSALSLPPDQRPVNRRELAELEAKRLTYRTKQIERARSLWQGSEPIAGTLAEAYLRGRGISGRLPPSLRSLRDAYHAPTGSKVAAMIALIEPSGAIHRTFLDAHGGKVGRCPKMMLGPVTGGAVRLSGGTGPLIVGEGIESTLSAAQALSDRDAQVWASLSTVGMKGLKLPDGPGELVIAGDNGAPGHEAANALAERASCLGWRVGLLMPPARFDDWNDAIQEGVHAT